MYDMIVDLDGTVADNSARLHHILSKPKNWKEYNKDIEGDLPIEKMIYLVGCVWVDGGNILFCTGRDTSVEEETVWWIENIFFATLKKMRMFDHTKPINKQYKLYLRQKGDYRPAYVVKSELHEQMLADGFNPQIAFDDDTNVVNMWRQKGILCLQSDISQYIEK